MRDLEPTTVPAEAVDSRRRFAGVARLYGELALQNFAEANLCVVGIGGVGSWVVEALARSAVGKITLIDLDMVAESNVNRQIHALSGEFGKAKVSVMAERILAINPDCAVSIVEDFLTPENLDEHLNQGFDYVVDAIDQVRTKAALIAWCRQRKTPVLSVGAAGGQTDPSRIAVKDLAHTIQDPLLAKVRALLRKQYGLTRDTKKKFNVPAIFSTEPVRQPQASTHCQTTELRSGLNCAGFGSSVCVTASFGLFAAAAVLEHLSRRVPETLGKR
ncbi:MAG: tRNA cyclic N6-threonylcarbamoyladenosine(37) synthase TcdA [Pseudomonadota bacterium]